MFVATPKLLESVICVAYDFDHIVESPTAISIALFAKWLVRSCVYVLGVGDDRLFPAATRWGLATAKKSIIRIPSSIVVRNSHKSLFQFNEYEREK